jgi:MRC1-like domain
MTAILDPSLQPFNLDAILQEFDVTKTSEPTNVRQDDSAVARVRESLGLGRSLFRRKDTQEPKDERAQTDEGDNADADMTGDNDRHENLAKPRKRILDSDDDDDPPPFTTTAMRSSPVQSGLNISDDESIRSGEDRDSGSDDELPSTENIVANFRKARLEALSAKVAAKTGAETEEVESAVSERSHSPARSASRSPPSSGKKQKVRKASKKALDEMHRETQRMVRNMALRPELKVSKKIEMSTIFAKFGFNPNKTNTEETSQSPKPETTTETPVETAPAPIEPPTMPDPPPPARLATPNLENSDSDDSLPSPSKLALTLPRNSQNTSTQKKSPPQRKIHFTLPASNTSDSDSDVEILPPALLTTHVATPDRKHLKRTALIRSLANLKSPGQKRSPGRMTQKELDATLSREAAIQAAKKREERRAELKSLGIDPEKIVEKRDLLEEAREEERRVREEEGVEESDEEYFDDEENDADNDEESGNDSEEEEDSGEDDMDDSEEGEDMVFETAQTKRKSRVVQITSDDEDDTIELKLSIVPESTIGSQPTVQALSELRSTDDFTLTQFFNPTQMSEPTENMTQKPNSQSQSESPGTGLTQFFTSTAMDDDVTLSGDDAAHSRMELLRQKGNEGNTNIAKESIGFPSALSNSSTPPLEPAQYPLVLSSNSGQSPVARRILKRRSKTTPNSELLPLETSEEFIKARKELIEEHAEESEDDYKVWGSGDESENENMDGVVEGLIDDETKVKKNAEREVARLYMYSYLR